MDVQGGRSRHCAVVHGDEMFVFGGHYETAYLSDLALFLAHGD